MGHSVTIFCAAVNDEPEQEVATEGYLVVRRGSGRGVYREARRFWRLEGRGNFDLVIDEVNTRPFFCVKFIREARVLVLIHQVAREVWFYESTFPIAIVGRHILEPLWLRRLRGAKIVTVSRSSQRSLGEYGLENVVIVPEGYEPKVRSQVDREVDLTLVFLGRLSANKRPYDAVEAFKIVKRAYPEAKLWVIGDGPERARLESGAVDGVEFLGHLSESEKIKRLSAAHLLVMTSAREGWGMVVTEAALLGTPTIGYSVDGLVDSISVHGGLCVDPNPQSLGQAICRYASGELRISVSDGLDSGSLQPWDLVAAELLQQVFPS